MSPSSKLLSQFSPSAQASFILSSIERRACPIRSSHTHRFIHHHLLLISARHIGAPPIDPLLRREASSRQSGGVGMPCPPCRPCALDQLDLAPFLQGGLQGVYRGSKGGLQGV
eukprot:1805856-Pyramimonas_sp.AAC.1